MAKGNGSSDALVGRTFDCVFDQFVPRLTFSSKEELRVQANIGGMDIDQSVAFELETIRPNLFVVSWVEENGNFIVQLQDHEAGIVHNHARLADGQVFRAQGALQQVAAASR